MNGLDTPPLTPREVTERYNLLVAGAREYAIFEVTPDGLLICWNPGAERAFGYMSNEVVGRHFSQFFTPEDVRNGRPEYELKTALADGHMGGATWQVRKDGTRFWCWTNVTPLFDGDKQLRAYARVMHDLTDAGAHEAERRRGDELAQANRNKEEFMAMLSHELRNPLAPILNAVNIQRRLVSHDPVLQQTGNIIERQVGKMVRMVDDLLDIGRITKGKLRLNRERIEFRGVVNRACESARPFLDSHRHEFSLSLPTEALWVDGDSQRLEQVVVNLLNNAAKFTNAGGLIRIAVVREGDEAVVCVKDNGIGIGPENLPRVFDLFNQAENSVVRSHGGLGIGLALVRTLVEMHDGRVIAASKGEGQGSEFTVRLPALANVPGKEAESAVTPVHAPDGRPLRILVVEDNIDSGDSLSLLLRLHGHEVMVARTGPTALAVSPAFRPELILMDIGLPGMDGYTVARRLRERPEFKGVVMCALTGYTPSDADKGRPEQEGFEYHFVKPVEFELLLDVLAKVGRRAGRPPDRAAGYPPLTGGH